MTCIAGLRHLACNETGATAGTRIMPSFKFHCLSMCKGPWGSSQLIGRFEDCWGGFWIAKIFRKFKDLSNCHLRLVIVILDVWESDLTSWIQWTFYLNIPLLTALPNKISWNALESRHFCMRLSGQIFLCEPNTETPSQLMLKLIVLKRGIDHWYGLSTYICHLLWHT